MINNKIIITIKIIIYKSINWISKIIRTILMQKSISCLFQTQIEKHKLLNVVDLKNKLIIIIQLQMMIKKI